MNSIDIASNFPSIHSIRTYYSKETKYKPVPFTKVIGVMYTHRQVNITTTIIPGDLRKVNSKSHSIISAITLMVIYHPLKSIIV